MTKLSTKEHRRGQEALLGIVAENRDREDLEKTRIYQIRDYANEMMGIKCDYHGKGLIVHGVLEADLPHIIRADKAARNFFKNGGYKPFEFNDNHVAYEFKGTIAQLTSMFDHNLRTIVYMESRRDFGNALINRELQRLRAEPSWNGAREVLQNDNLGYIVLNDPKIIEAEENQAFARAQKPWRHESPTSP